MVESWITRNANKQADKNVLMKTTMRTCSRSLALACLCESEYIPGKQHHRSQGRTGREFSAFFGFSMDVRLLRNHVQRFSLFLHGFSCSIVTVVLGSRARVITTWKHEIILAANEAEFKGILHKVQGRGNPSRILESIVRLMFKEYFFLPLWNLNP